VLNYEQSMSVGAVQKGRGTANTILMIQVPHDGVAGVTPWIAGGGSTLRGVPEKHSIAPFVLSTDRDGKVIQRKGKRGTYALMTDGSVRFMDQNVSDDVFKAMCTVSGPAPEKFNLDADENTPLDPDPKAPPKATKTIKLPAKAPVKTEPAKEEKKADDDKKPAATKAAEEKKAASKEELKAPPAAEQKTPASDEKKALPGDEQKTSWAPPHRPETRLGAEVVAWRVALPGAANRS
jgi:hypothetical protein